MSIINWVQRLEGLWWLLLLIGLLFFLQRRLHYELQAIFLLITRRTEITAILFFVLFLPGVLLHELSHLLTAFLLGVKISGFSLLPRILPATPEQPAQRLQMGRVMTSSADILRDGLIGAAPLVTGGIFVTFAGLSRLHFDRLWNSLAGWESQLILSTARSLLVQPDFWIWFYLILVVSSTMLPSASDRRAWLPLALVTAILIFISFLAGAGNWLLSHLEEPYNRSIRACTIVLGISASIHLTLLVPLYPIRRILSKVTGMRVA